MLSIKALVSLLPAIALCDFQIYAAQENDVCSQVPQALLLLTVVDYRRRRVRRVKLSYANLPFRARLRHALRAT